MMLQPLSLAQFVIAASKQCACTQSCTPHAHRAHIVLVSALDEGVAFLDAAIKNLSDTKVKDAIEAKESKHQVTASHILFF